MANLKNIIQSESIMGNEDVYEFEIYYLRVTRNVIIKQSHNRVFCYQTEHVSNSCSPQSTWN